LTSVCSFKQNYTHLVSAGQSETSGPLAQKGKPNYESAALTAELRAHWS